jgi:MoxR-like ATPase
MNGNDCLHKEELEALQSVRNEVAKVVVGMEHLVERLIIGVLCGGHVLVEGAPGLAKTLTIRTLSQVLGVSFSRIQFTPDLLPGDLIGTLVYNQQSGDFTPHLGPVFANMVLADEINRSPAKVQSALLEAMEEKQVTIGKKSYPLEQPFLVLATQNPVEQEGTYPLPEAQLDRFMFKVLIDYPTVDQEEEVLKRMSAVSSQIQVNKMLGAEKILKIRGLLDGVHAHDDLQRYVVELVDATRNPSTYGLEDLGEYIRFGASPRASLAMIRGARALAFIEGRDYATPSDVRKVCHDVLRHRIVLSYRAESEGLTTDRVIDRIVKQVPICKES